MRTIKRITAVTIVILSAIICLAQFGSKKSVHVGRNSQPQATEVALPDAEDFSLISLLTLKFM